MKDALTVMGSLLEDESLLAGGSTGAEQTDFNGSVTQVFADPPKGAIIFEGDFVGGVVTGETNAKLGTDADFRPHRSTGRSQQCWAAVTSPCCSTTPRAARR